MTLVLGIDEAGRGPVIGPLVLCGYMIEESGIYEIKKTGARDSKLLTDDQRRKLEPKLKEMAKDFAFQIVTAKEIDSLRKEKNLNRIEIESMQKLINLMNPDKVIIDSPETNTKKFSDKIKEGLKNKDVKLICENYADKKYPIVSAASILAKVLRDNAIAKISKQIGHDLGTGYPHDEKTTEFLKKIYAKDHAFPEWVRQSWATSKEIMRTHKSKREQKSVKDFFK